MEGRAGGLDGTLLRGCFLGCLLVVVVWFEGGVGGLPRGTKALLALGTSGWDAMVVDCVLYYPTEIGG